MYVCMYVCMYAVYLELWLGFVSVAGVSVHFVAFTDGSS